MLFLCEKDAKNKVVEDVVILSGDHLYRMDYMDFVQVIHPISLQHLHSKPITGHHELHHMTGIHKTNFQVYSACTLVLKLVVTPPWFIALKAPLICSILVAIKKWEILILSNFKGTPH